ncbi:hypothetical protein PR202_gb24537 [Eleusine coracana subsp. coracana]|uniref:Uncharacterized protein n=1 Tax=Eleusine coracana subsp. coracana TaxID=191504 RepID=A0AAV5FLM7_ELECO|nr:hypothetical protein PR202_gb24537 [Eleusine coracana subsp. coracana]
MMGSESTLSLEKHEEDKNDPEASQVVNCESSITEEVKKSLTEEPFLLVCVENKGGTKSIDTVCDPEFCKDDVAEAVTPRADILELIIATGSPDDNLSVGSETPRESIFDPFAPGPEEVACAPKKKVIGGAEVLSRRQLNFESGDYPVKRLSFGADDAEEEDQYLLVLENMILDLIMPNGFLYQAEKTKTTPIDLSPKTPDSKPLLTGIATTCPDAPMRSSLKVFKLSPSICRKIDFDSVSDSVYHGSSVARDNN